MKKPLIKINDFSFTFGSKEVLKTVSLQIYPGEYLSIIGPNGAGKSTLLKCLMRILRGGQGTISLKDKPLAHYRHKELARLISYVPQGDGRSMPFTVGEFVLMGRYPHLSPFTTFSIEDKQAAREALALTGTAHFAERRLNTLSGGERQTVYIASAIAQGASIMLLDEPTTFLDPKHESDILDIIKNVNRRFGITVVSVTHDINSAVMCSDRIASLKNGRVMFDGDAEKIMDNEVLENIYEKRFSFVRHPATGKLIIVP
ncbi:MAG: ABC transporter ATP-binding protein [Gemmatimonadota bacterium]|nr:ABC transporter ATP-binding protein [Gemmatimonadota bacterium]